MFGIKKTYACAAIGRGGLLLVEARKTGGKWLLNKCYCAAMPEGEAAVKDAVARAAASSGMRSCKVSLSIPDAPTLSTILDFEELPDREHEAGEVVKWRLSKELYIKPEEYRIDHTIISRDHGIRVLAVAAKDSFVRAYEEAFVSSGFVIENIRIHAVSLFNLLGEVVKGEREFAVIVCNDALSIMFFRNGKLAFYRCRPLNEACDNAFKLTASTFTHYMGKNSGSKLPKTYIFGGDAYFSESVGKLFASEAVNVSAAMFLRQDSAETPGINPLQIMSALGATV